MQATSGNEQRPHATRAETTARRADEQTATSVAPDVKLWIPPGSNVPPSRDGTPSGPRRWLTERRLRRLGAIMAILVIGAGILYWRGGGRGARRRRGGGGGGGGEI